jgi:hypothetical protein
MRTRLTAALTLALLATPLVAASPAGAQDGSNPGSWPAAADVPSVDVVIDLSGDGVHDVWVLDVATRRHDRRDDHDLARRCRAAELTPEQCRRILHQDDERPDRDRRRDQVAADRVADRERDRVTDDDRVTDRAADGDRETDRERDRARPVVIVD